MKSSALLAYEAAKKNPTGDRVLPEIDEKAERALDRAWAAIRLAELRSSPLASVSKITKITVISGQRKPARGAKETALRQKYRVRGRMGVITLK